MYICVHTWAIDHPKDATSFYDWTRFNAWYATSWNEKKKKRFMCVAYVYLFNIYVFEYGNSKI